MNKKNKLWVKPALFLIILAFLFSLISPLFTVSDYRIYHTVRGFYKEKPKSLDAIYLGASNVYAFWQGPAAFKEFGIACYGMSIPSMPVAATKYYIEECRKTQPDALFIINLNNFKSNGVQVTKSDIHNVANFLPMSKTKVKLINELAGELGYTGMDKAEFYLPIIRFHSGWNEFTTNSFDKKLNGLKGASSYSTFLKKSINVKNDFCYTNKKGEVSEDQTKALSDLVTYLQNEKVKTLFVFAPQAVGETTSIEQINTLKSYVITEGFDVVDMMEDVDSLKLDFTSDFYDTYHLNIHGSLKFTRKLASYLKENYNFNDKRGNAAYASWDKAAKEYTEIIKPYTLDFERENSLRDNALLAPTLTSCKAYGQSIKISWKESAGALGYSVYRRYNDTATNELTPWELVANVDCGTLEYTDKKLARNTGYRYTVVPTYIKDGKTVYGNFNISGIGAKTTIPAPKLLTLDESNSKITITWKAQKGAEGYVVYRKIVGQEWVKLEQLQGNITTYTDKNYQSDLPYLYTVKAYEMIDGAQQNGDHQAGLLRYKDIASPKPIATLTKKGAQISWETVKGASNYSVYIKSADGNWNILAEHIESTSCLDETYVEGASPTYKVVAEIKHGNKYYEFPSDPIALTKGDN